MKKKIRINGKKHCAQIQESLFNLGFKWDMDKESHNQPIQHLRAVWIFLNDFYITYSDSVEYGYNHYSIETTIDEIMGKINYEIY